MLIKQQRKRMAELTDLQQRIIDEIDVAKQNVKTDGYAMSIGELINLYRDGDIVLDPAFQRLFRWDDDQKTKLIESILIGIPVPEIFVAQKSDGTWHVVDGVQRISTILQLAGVLEDYEALTLGACKYIPSMDGQTWDSLPLGIQRSMRRSKLKISIILTESSDEAQYELFQRLNTGGTSLSEQEVRNCLMLMLDEKFFNLINDLKEYDNFKDCLTLKPEDYDEEVHMELILRMLIGFKNTVRFEDHGSLHRIIFSDFIDKETARLIRDGGYEQFTAVFKRTFDKLKNCLGQDSFKKFDVEEDRFKGAFNISVFEMLTVGLATNIDTVEQVGNEELVTKIKGIYSQEAVTTGFGRGVRAIKRFKDVTEFSRGYFA